MYALTECEHEPTTLNAKKCDACIDFDKKNLEYIFKKLKDEVVKLINQKCTDDKRKPKKNKFTAPVKDLVKLKEDVDPPAENVDSNGDITIELE